MPIITGPAGMDPILGEMRTIDISGGTGGGGDYTFNSSEFTVGITGLVSLNQVPGNKVSGTASVEDVQTGGAERLVDVSALRGALTAGQAVDVTSQPDNVTGDYKGTFSVTGSLGFASFPKYASALNYLFIADLTATTSGTVTPSGTWLDGTSTAKSLAAGTSTRVAMLFNAANKAKFTFASTGSVSVSNCREYEVTACTNEAIAYIAALNNPDAFASYYLVKADMVQPWTYIIDMGSSPAVTIASGLSYKLNATIGVHQLTVDTCPVGYDGHDAIIRIKLGGSGVIQAVPPLQLGGALVPYAINNCVVRYRDGEAVLLVEDTLAGYVVTLTSGTGEGSLPYGLAAVGVPYIAFSPSTDGIPVDLSGATTAAEEVTVVGNGYAETMLTGAINCTSKTIFANLTMSGVVNSGGTMTLGDVFIPAGGTVSVSGGGLAIERVIGDGTIDLNDTTVIVPNSGNALVSSCTIINGSGGNGGAFALNSSSYVRLDHVTASNCLAAQGGLARVAGEKATLELNSCSVTSCTATYGGGIAIANNTAQVSMSNSVVSGNKSPSNFPNDVVIFGGTMYVNGGNTVGIAVIRSPASSSARVELRGSNLIGAVTNFGSGFAASITISSDAIVDLTGTTHASPIMPGGGITFASGGATVQLGATSGTVDSSYMMDNVTLPAGAKLTNTAVVDLGGTHITSPDTITGCTLTGGRTYAPGASPIGRGGAVLFGSSGTLTDCTISGNVAQQGGGVCVQLAAAVCTCSNCTITNNTPDDVRVTAGKLVLSGGTYGVCATAGAINVAGTTRIGSVTGNGSVTISGGAIINLTSSINPSGGITVLTGGCTVNGNVIPAGTYTSIDSNGQPT